MNEPYLSALKDYHRSNAEKADAVDFIVDEIKKAIDRRDFWIKTSIPYKPITVQRALEEIGINEYTAEYYSAAS